MEQNGGNQGMVKRCDNVKASHNTGRQLHTSVCLTRNVTTQHSCTIYICFQSVFPSHGTQCYPWRQGINLLPWTGRSTIRLGFRHGDWETRGLTDTHISCVPERGCFISERGPSSQERHCFTYATDGLLWIKHKYRRQKEPELWYVSQ